MDEILEVPVAPPPAPEESPAEPTPEVPAAPPPAPEETPAETPEESSGEPSAETPEETLGDSSGETSGFSAYPEIDLTALEAKLDNVLALMESPPPRPFLDTPFEEYTVSEGFGLLFLGAVVVGVLYHFVRRFML